MNAGKPLLSYQSAVAILVGLLALSASGLSAQTRDFSNRVEGTLELHGDADMELIGLTREPLSFGPRSTLKVGFFLPRASGGQYSPNPKRVLIQAREIIPTHKYFMRSKPAEWVFGQWNVFGPWPTADIIDPLGVNASNVSVLASYGLDDGTWVFLPVAVSSSSLSYKSLTYSVEFTTSWDAHSIEWTLTGPTGNTRTLSSIQCKVTPTCTIYNADSSHSFEIDMSDQAEGLYRLHAVEHVPNSLQKPELSVVFYHSQAH